MMREKLCSLLLLLAFGPASVGAQDPLTVPGDVLVMLEPGGQVEGIVTDLHVLDGIPTGLHVVKEVSAPMRTWLLHYDAASVQPEVMLRAVRSHNAVQLAQHNHLVKERSVPDDPQYADQWHHVNINSSAAWDISTGGITATGDTIVVCIIERADLTHPDLAANAWHNIQEIPGNGLDDDGNGYMDDYRGWNTPNGDDNVYGTNHGTQVAGMIGAVGNNALGVAGANWNVKMVPVAYGGTQEAEVVAAYTYPLIMRRRYNDSDGATGAFIVATNASWGIDNGQPADSPLWCAMFDSLGSEGILNCGATANNNVDVDVVGDLPTACPSEYLVSVTATNAQDQRTFSGYGLTTIDVGAPGAAVYTTFSGGGYGPANGTSFASPLTAGVIALLYSAPCGSLMQLVHADPPTGALYVRDMLFNGVDEVGNLPGTIATGGRINAGTSMQLIMDACGPCPTPYALDAVPIDLTTVQVAWSVVAGSTFDLRYRVLGAPAWTDITSIAEPTYTLSGLLTCTPYEFQVRVHCGVDASDYSSSHIWTSEGCCDPPENISVVSQLKNGWGVFFDPVIGAVGYVVRYREVGTVDWILLDIESGPMIYFIVQEGCTPYEVQVATVCVDGVGEWSNSILFTSLGCGSCIDLDYCASQGQSTASEWIERVVVNGQEHISGNDGGYGDHTGVSFSLEAYPDFSQIILLVPGYPSVGYTEWWSVWLDSDQDGLFAETERIFQSVNGSTVPVSFDTGELPALEGITRMRIAMKYGGNAADACTAFNNGEVEDYCVNVIVAGVGELVNNGVRVFPSPADDRLNIELDSPAFMVGGRSTLLNASGRVVARIALSPGRNVLDISTLPQGLYAYRVEGLGTGIAQGRFVVMH